MLAGSSSAARCGAAAPSTPHVDVFRHSARPAARSALARPFAQRHTRPTATRAATAPPAVALDAEAQAIVADEGRLVVQTYGRPSDFVVASGHGSVLVDTNGKEYLDFYGGIAVNSIGHAHPRWVAAVTEAAGTLTHVSNLFHTKPQVELARRLVGASFADRVFYANSGTEANEAAIKIARKFAKVRAGVDPYDAGAVAEALAADPPGFAHELVSFSGSFHGRTFGALSVTSKQRYRTPYEPLVPGASAVPYGDFEAAERAIVAGRTAAVLVEPIQGEGGVLLPPPGWLAHLRRLCDAAGALLIFDEVQVGLGRTGHLFAYEGPAAGGGEVVPDMLTLAKPLAGGLPIGAVLLREEVAAVMKPGDHGSTFAGGPLVTAAATAAFDILSDEALLEGVRRKGRALVDGLRAGLAATPAVREVRGEGLIVGIQLDRPADPVVALARERGLLVITAGAGDVLRLVPPLVVTDEQVAQAIEILVGAIKDVTAT